jgi:hypothetical protein
LRPKPSSTPSQVACKKSDSRRENVPHERQDENAKIGSDTAGGSDELHPRPKSNLKWGKVEFSPLVFNAENRFWQLPGIAERLAKWHAAAVKRFSR